jgi:hypothetical protein
MGENPGQAKGFPWAREAIKAPKLIPRLRSEHSPGIMHSMCTPIRPSDVGSGGLASSIDVGPSRQLPA